MISKKPIRIIPRLDIKGPNLVKGIHLEGLRVLGKPSDFAKYYYENGADELIFMDVVASLYERNSLHNIIEESSKSIFIPITVGGGIRNLNDIKSLLRIGADKVSINTAAIKRPELIKEASEEFGSSTIVATIEAIKNTNGKYLAFIDNGREFTGKEVLEWAIELESLGAGELIITSVDREGTGRGIDLELINNLNNSLTIPIIAHGGIGSKEDVVNLFNNKGCESVAIASALHYEAVNNIELNIDNSEGNIDFLLNKTKENKIKSFNIREIKLFLREHKINCR